MIKPKFCWKYHFKIELLTNGYYELIRHNFNWTGTEPNQVSTDKGPGLFVGSGFNSVVAHLREKKHIPQIVVNPSYSIFKVNLQRLMINLATLSLCNDESLSDLELFSFNVI